MVNDGQNNAANPIHLHDFIADLSCVFVTAAAISRRRSSLTKKLTCKYEYYCSAPPPPPLPSLNGFTLFKEDSNEEKYSTLVIALVVGSLCCSSMHMVVWTAATVCSVILPFHDHRELTAEHFTTFSQQTSRTNFVRTVTRM